MARDVHVVVSERGTGVLNSFYTYFLLRKVQSGNEKGAHYCRDPLVFVLHKRTDDNGKSNANSTVLLILKQVMSLYSLSCITSHLSTVTIGVFIGGFTPRNGIYSDR